MLNELLRDPVIQSKYQFMLYMYPTGVPIPIAAAGLRESLIQAKAMYDPDGRDPAFEQMVLLGHSMGGILSRTVAVASGDQFWRLYSDRRSTRSSAPRRAGRAAPLFLLRAAAVRQPGRSPGHAAPRLGLSRGVVGRVGTSLISDPDHIHKLLYQLVKDNPDAFDSRRFRRLPTSIETLEPNSPILTALLNMQPPPPPQDIKFHSIIGSLRPDRGRRVHRWRGAVYQQPSRRGCHRKDRPLGPRRAKGPRGHSRGAENPARTRRRRQPSPRSFKRPEPRATRRRRSSWKSPVAER